MEVKLENQCNTLGSLLRDKLELESNDEFATCVVPEITSTYLLVTTPSISVLRKALLACKEEMKDIKVTISNKSYKNKSNR